MTSSHQFMIIASLIVTVSSKYFPSALTKDAKVVSDNKASFVETAASQNYIAQEFKVTTEDGYILNTHRIRSSKCGVYKPQPLFLMSGLLQSSEAWLDAGPNSSLAYLLANDCYDLWFGNYRGNTNGRAHISLNPDRDAAFWDYNIEHIGYYDVPAMVDFALNYTRADKLTYIGFSQGGGSFLIACSLRPEFSSKIQLFIGLAPSTRFAPTGLFRTLVLIGSFVHRNVPHWANWQEVFTSTGAVSVVRELCEFSTVSALWLRLCEGYLGLLDSMHRDSLTDETHARLHAHYPAGASGNLLDHFAQLLEVKTFRRYDFGRWKNLQIYGRAEAPDVDLKSVNVTSVIFYGLNDGIVTSETVEWLLTQLPNIVGVEKISEKAWNHVDMFYSKYLKEFVYDSMMKYLVKYSSV